MSKSSEYKSSKSLADALLALCDVRGGFAARLAPATVVESIILSHLIQMFGQIAGSHYLIFIEWMLEHYPTITNKNAWLVAKLFPFLFSWSGIGLRSTLLRRITCRPGVWWIRAGWSGCWWRRRWGSFLLICWWDPSSRTPSTWETKHIEQPRDRNLARKSPRHSLRP